MASASLTACATHTASTRPNADAFLQPTLIEGRYHSIEEVMADPCSTTRDLIDFGGNAQDALRRANADKESARKVLDAKPVACKTKVPELDTIRVTAPKREPHRAALRLHYLDGLCSGTAVAPHTLLTATHCMDGAPLATINNIPTLVLAQVDDGNDHTLVTVVTEFPVWSPIAQRKPVQGEPVRYWGNPMGLADVYREGYVGGYCNVPDVCMDVPPVRTGKLQGEAYMLITQGAPGDSGAGVLDARGNVIGVVSAVQYVAVGLTPMEGLPLAFAPATLEAMK